MLTFKSYASSSKGNVNTITDGQTTVMLDCGLAWKKTRELMNFNTSSVGSIFITHQHGDHSAGVKDAVRAGVEVYMLQETREALGLSGHRFHDIEYGKPIRVNGLRILAFPIMHDVPCCGFLISGGGEKATYITDTAFVPNKMPADLNLLAIECNFSAEILEKNTMSGSLSQSLRHRLVNSHFGLEEVIDFIKANNLKNLKEIWLLHLSDGNSDEALFVKRVQEETGVPVYACGA
jgi:phosphoribosyl 1,2-cyclic phosphodiesterase